MNLDLPHDIEVGEASEEYDIRRDALKEAASAYYIAGGTRDYVGALYRIVELLGGKEMAERMGDDPGAVYRELYGDDD